MDIKKIAIITFLLIFLLFSSQQVCADELIDAQGYFSWLNGDGTWNDWVNCTKESEEQLYSLELSIGQPIKCKVNIVVHDNCTLSFRLNEPGETNAFDVISGADHDKSIIVKENGICVTDTHLFDVLIPETKVEYTWFLKANNNWTGGHAPVRVYIQADFKGTPDGLIPRDAPERSGSIGFANPYILNDKWCGPGIDDIVSSIESQQFKVPGFETFIVVCALMLFSISKKSYKN